MSKKPISVLTTVNAPYSQQLNEADLAYCLTHLDAAKQYSGQVSSFFSEVPLDEQIAFAALHGISADSLKALAKAFSAWSGETYQLVA